MIFGLITGAERQAPELCIFPDKPSSFTVPVKVSSLVNTDYGIHFVSIEEGFTVSADQNDGGIIVTAVRPNVFYLTPNLPHRPGFRVDRLKIIKAQVGYTVFYDRGKGWESYNPNRQIL